MSLPAAVPPAAGEPPDPRAALFSESAARAIAVVRAGSEAAFAALCHDNGVPTVTIGTTGGAALELDGLFTVPVDELAAAYRGTLPALFG